MEKKLTKSFNKMIAGVCGGIGEYLNIDATIVRIVYICLSIFSTCFPGVLLYILLAIFMPKAETENGDRLRVNN